MNSICTYQLEDPRAPGFPWYVGKGNFTRAQSHWRKFIKGSAPTNKNLWGWFNKLLSDGLSPVVRVIDHQVECRGRNWEKFEKLHIRLAKVVNKNLTNISEGGYVWPPGASAKGIRSAWKKHRKIMLENCQNNGQLVHKLYPELFREIARVNGKMNGAKNLKIARENHPELMREGAIRGGQKGGPAAGHKTGKANLSAAWKTHREVMLKNQKSVARLGGLIGGRKATHLRWHAARGITNSNCEFCVKI